MSLVPVILAGCGGAATVQQETPSGPTCAQVAAHLVELAMKDNGATELPDNMRGVEATYTKQCQDEAWAPKRRSCLLGAANEEATLQCK
jgi:hypothetical protein